MKKREFKISMAFAIFSIWLIILWLLLAWFQLYTQRQLINQETLHDSNNIKVLYDTLLTEEAKFLEGQIDLLEKSTPIQTAWLSQDRDRLFELAKTHFDRINQKYDVTHFYFIKPNLTSFLRVHRPQYYGDKIERFTAETAQKSGKTFAGIELGYFGHFTLRVVRPWIINEKLVGYLELGREVNHLTSTLHKSTGIDLFLMIDKSFLNKEKFEVGSSLLSHKVNWDSFESEVLVDGTKEGLVESLELMIQLSQVYHDLIRLFLDHNEHKFQTELPLKDAAHQTVGRILLFVDITEKVHNLRNNTIYHLTLILLSCLVFFAFSRYLHGLEAKDKSNQELLSQSNHSLDKSLKQLQRDHNLISSLINESTDIVIIKDQEGRYLFASPKMLALSQKTIEEVLGKKDEEIWDPIVSKSILIDDMRIKEMNGVDSFEEVLEIYEKKMTFWTTKGVLHDHNENIIGIFSISRDHTDIIKSKQVIKRLATAVNQINEVVFITDPEGNIQYDNQAFKNNEGIFPEELFQECNFNQKTVCPTASQTKEIFQTIIQHQTWNGQLTLEKKEETRTFKANISGIYDRMKKLINLIFICEDITDEIHHRTRQIQSQKMESIGMLAAGVAHEINNPLGYINSNLTSLREYVYDLFKILELSQALEDSDENNREEIIASIRNKKEDIDFDYIKQDFPILIQDTEEGVNRAVAVVNNLREFSRSAPKEIEEINLNQLMQKSLKLTENQTKYKVDLHLDFNPIPLFLGNSQEIGQVFINLLVNGAQAISNNGDLWIKTIFMDNAIEIRVKDNGCGISPENQAKIFEPFFTTKDINQGTGLGLSISYNIIKKHGGLLSVKSKLNEWSEFIIRFPS